MSVRLIFKSVWQNPGNRGHRIERLIRAGLWQLRKRCFTGPQPIALANGITFNAHPDCVTSSALMYSDWPEFRELHFIRGRLQSNDVILDVGANVGHISLLLADVVAAQNIFAFEPTPISFRRLTANWKANRWPVEQLFNAAVGRAPGMAFIPNPTRPNTKNAVTDLAGKGVEVPVIALDQLRQRWRGRRVGLLAIDVEGYELEVLSGATELLSRDRPRTIMFEALGGSVAPEISVLFDRVRYSVFQLGKDGQPDFENCSEQNLFAVPNEEVDSVRRCSNS